MKKVLLGSAFLAVIGIGITATQLSCSKTTAQTTNYTLPPATTSTLGGVIVGSGLTVSSNGTLSANSTSGGLTQLNKILLVDNTPSGNQSQSFVVINSDGTGKSIIPITLPTGRTFASQPANGQLSVDGKTLYFEVYEVSTSNGFLYSCGLDGSNLKVVYTQSNGYPSLQGTY